jgi:UDP-glucose 4-epimerase
MSKMFITGGAGFIGSHLVDKLIEAGNEVTVYDNLSSGKADNIKHHFGKDSFGFVEADLLDFETLKQSMKGHEVVCHLAANPEAREGITKTDLDLKIGTIATYNVLEAMRMNEIKRLIFSSSGTVCGETPLIPVSEDYGPLLPISLYGASKLACEGLISAFCHTFGMQAWVFRFANIVGARATHGVIYDFIHKLRGNSQELEILGDGTQEKPYLSVDDCVDGMLCAFHNSSKQFDVFNLGCTTTTTVTRIAQITVEEMGLNDVRFKYTGGERGWLGDVPQFRFDVEKMAKLGWKARRASDETVRLAVRSLLKEL